MAWVRTHPLNSKFRLKMGVMPDFSGASLVKAETPVGEMNSENRKFTLLQTPVEDSIDLYKDGMRLRPATSELIEDGDFWYDYTNHVLWFSKYHIPQPTSVILVDYRSL